MADKTKDLLAQGRTAFERCQDAESDNRQTALDDIRFSRLSDQWPENIRKQREQDLRPCLTINKMPAFIRQVVNDSRQNKPSIKVHAADSGADPATADVMNGLIRNIEYASDADVAYDTAIESSVSGGFGYWRVGMDYAYDDAFEMDLTIDRVANQFSIYGDPDSMGADSSDWNLAFVVEPIRKAEYISKYKGKKNADGDECCVDFESDAWTNAGMWFQDDMVMLAEWWKREEVDREIVKLSNGFVYDKADVDGNPDIQALLQAGAVQIVGSRTTKTHKVTQIILSGADVLAVNDWPGRYIPIVPVYGDEIVLEGKRYFRSLIHDAKDPQRMLNFWRTNSTELVALAPRVPWIGRKGTFDSDAARWSTANTTSHSYLEFDTEAPQRQPLDVGPAAGALQEALNASDDMKAVMGVFDASLGARSNETSGRAIMARQREGDVSTFHFIDNLARAIRHTGRILIDLIPKVYSGERIIRVIGEDGEQETRPINQQYPQTDPKTGQPMQQPQMGPNGQPMTDEQGNPLLAPIMAIHDLTAGKYDLTVTTGPSFTSRREEAAASMTEMVRAFPASAPIVMPELAKQLDWPGADKIADKMEELASNQIPPQAQQAIEQSKKQIDQLTVQLQQLSQENQQLKQDQSDKIAAIQADQQVQIMKLGSEEKIAAAKIESQKQIEFYKAQANYAAASAKASSPQA
jgi:hypothetical protein